MLTLSTPAALDFLKGGTHELDRDATGQRVHFCARQHGVPVLLHPQVRRIGDLSGVS